MNQKFAPLLLNGIYKGIFHNILIYLADEHLGYAQFGAIANKASLNIHVHDFGRHMFLFILGKYLVVEWLDHIISLCLTL